MDVQTQMHLKTFRELLTYRLNELRGTVNADRIAFMDAASGDGETSSDPSFEAQLRRDVAELASIELALHRLDNGLYGDCVECRQPIPYGTLLARPDTQRCGACEALHAET